MCWWPASARSRSERARGEGGVIRAGQKVPWEGGTSKPAGPPDILLLVLAPHQATAGSAGAFVLSTVPFCSGTPGVWPPLSFFIPGDAALRWDGWPGGGLSRQSGSQSEPGTLTACEGRHTSCKRKASLTRESAGLGWGQGSGLWGAPLRGGGVRGGLCLSLPRQGSQGCVLLLARRSVVGIGHRMDERMLHLVAVPFGRCTRQNRARCPS